jgi:hypothetical protein
MSLAVLADHMASKGRGPDSMLIHMSPSEVQGLQALAMKHGGSLTINPETGLPEAGFLDKLLPAIIGFAVTAATGLPAWQVGLGVGAVETARTGDFGKGVRAGLGAYGGAGFGAGMTTMGTEALGSQATNAARGLTGDMAFNLADAGSSFSNALAGGETGILNSSALSDEAIKGIQQQTAERVASASPFDKLSAGFDAAKANPSSLLTKDNAKYLLAAAAPVLADQAVKANLPTTTTRPGEVHRFSYNPYNQYYTPTGNYEVPVKSAAGGGLMGMDNGGYNPGQLNFTGGGDPIVRMAKGGIAHYAIGGDTKAAIDAAYAAGDYAKVNELAQTNQITAADVADTYKGFDTSGLAGLGINLYNPNYTVADNGSFVYDTPVVNTPVVNTPVVNTPVVNTPAVDTPVVDTVAQDYWNDLAAKRDAAANAANQATWNQQNTDAWNKQNTDKWNAQNQATWAAQAAVPVKYTTAQLDAFFKDPKNKNVNIEDAIKQFNADPASVNAYIASLTSGYKGPTDALDINTKGTGTLGIYNDLISRGIDATEYYNAAIKNDPKYAGWSKADIERGYQIDKGIYAVGDQLKGVAADSKLGYDRQWVKFMDDNKYSALDMAKATGLSIKEINDRYNAVKLADTKPVITCGPGYRLNAAGTACEPNPVTTVVGGGGNDVITTKSGYHLENGQWVKNVDATQNTSTSVTTPTNLFTAPSTSLPVGIAGNTGPSQIGGGATINPNGTITTSPRIPDIPIGGFTGATNLRDTYEKGGGNLGVNKNLFVPKTTDELNAKYKLTGGSKAAYDYLTGKTKYSPLPVTETGEIMKPYAESVLGMPANKSSKQYLYDPDTRKYTLNPDFIPISYTDKGEKVYGLSSKDIAAQLPSLATSDYEKWMQDNNVTIAQIAQSLGISLAEAKKRYGKGTTGTTTAGTTATGSENDTRESGGAAAGGLAALTMARGGTTHMPFFSKSTGKFTSRGPQVYADGGAAQFNLGGYSDGGRLLRGPGDGVSDSIPATIGNKRPARLADGEFVVPARIVSELGNGSTEAGARKLYAMMDRVQAARKGSIGKGKVAKNSRADKYLPA